MPTSAEIAQLQAEVARLGQIVKHGRATDTEAINAMRETLDRYIPWIETQMERDRWWAALRREVMTKVITGGVWGCIVGLVMLVIYGVAHWVRETVAK